MLLAAPWGKIAKPPVGPLMPVPTGVSIRGFNNMIIIGSDRRSECKLGKIVSVRSG